MLLGYTYRIYVTSDVTFAILSDEGRCLWIAPGLSYESMDLLLL